jgi:hypothetical protein
MRRRQAMGVIHVYLEDGFDRDDVTISAGAERLAESDVTTRHQIGLARAVDLAAPDGGPVAMTIALPGRGLTAEVAVDPTATPYVRVSIVDGSLAIRAESAAPMFA